MSVTVLLGGDPADFEPTVDYAINLARRMGRPLTGLCALPDPSAAIMYITGAEAIMVGNSALASLTDAQTKMATEYETQFLQRTSKENWLQAKFTKEVGSVAAQTVAAGLLADALVLPRAATSSMHPLNPGFEQSLMEARLPLVLAPTRGHASDTCLIAWDDSPLAARAVKFHMPLIESYKTAILAYQPEKIRHQWAHGCQPSKARLIEVLHDKRLNVIEETLDGSVAEGLLATAKTHDAATIIMGAYGHNRLGELLFGGTTHSLFQNSDAPALAVCH